MANYSEITAAIMNLNAWEERLASLIPEVHLLGEIPLSGSDVEEISHSFRLVGPKRVLKSKWPYTLTVYMATVAARNDEGQYWRVLTESLGIENTPYMQRKLGQCFEMYLFAWNHLYGLPTFSSVGGYNYVTPIRLHGGIPAYSLPDFFAEVLLPAVRKPEYAGMDVPELIEQVLQRSAVQYFVDSPVRYFLQHGGETAQDFFKRCLDMVAAWEGQGNLPSAKELGLPGYVVRAFQEFMEGRLQTPKGKRLRPPRLYLDPYDPDSLFRLELPQEPVDAGQTGWRHEWCIAALTEWGASPIESVPVRVRREGGGFVTNEAEHPPEAPPSHLRVEFQARNDDNDHQIMGRWFFDLAPQPGEPPVIAFRSEDGRLVRRDAGLPGDVLWLLTPASLKVQAPNRGRLIMEAPYLSGAWSDWKIEEWDLTGAQIVQLVDPGSGQVRHSVPVQVGQNKPRLRGEKLHQARNQEEVPFFVGEPPHLWLPRLTGQTPEQEMAVWRIRFRDEGDADPTPPYGETSLAELAARGTCQVEEEGFLLLLATLLGDQAAGAYTVELEGPRRFRSEQSFRIWPLLTVEDLAPYYLPGSDGPTPVVFHVQTRPTDRLVPVEEAAGVEVTATETPGQYQVTVQPDSTAAKLVLVQPGKMEIQLPLEVSVPRLRWTVRLDKETLDWTTEPLTLPVDKLLESQHVNMILAWEGAEQAPKGRLLLRDAATSGKPVLQEAEVAAPRRSSRTSVDLVRFRDTLRGTSDVSNFDLALALEETEDAAALPLLHLGREIGVSCVLLEWTAGGSVVLHWEAAHRLRNRRVRLWSAWQPWEPAQEFAIPDDVTPAHAQDAPGSGVFLLPVQLKPGAYWVAFRTAPEWETCHAPSFPTDDSLLAECDEVDAQQRLKAIEDQRASGKISPFLAAFERACIFHLQKNCFLRDREVENAIAHLAAAYPKVIIALHGWLQALESDLAAKLRVHMYRPEHLKRLFERNFPQHVVDAYMARFRDTEFIKPESAELVLKRTHNPEWQGHAVAVLIRETHVGDNQTIVERIRQGVFSEAVGLDLLAENPEEALMTLYRMPSEPLRDRLLRALALRTQSPKVVRPGIWVRSEAGWGRVREIAVDGRPQAYLLIDQAGEPLQPAVLRIELLRAEETLEAQIDMKKQIIRIEGAEQVFLCAKEGCPGFAALNQEEIRENHCKAAHRGLSPAFRPSPPEWNYGHSPKFSWEVHHYYG